MNFFLFNQFSYNFLFCNLFYWTGAEIFGIHFVVHFAVYFFLVKFHLTIEFAIL